MLLRSRRESSIPQYNTLFGGRDYDSIIPMVKRGPGRDAHYCAILVLVATSTQLHAEYILMSTIPKKHHSLFVAILY